MGRAEGEHQSAGSRRPGDRIALAGTPAESTLRQVNIDTERHLAQVRSAIAICTFPLGTWLTFSNALPLLMPAFGLIVLLAILLVYAVGYLLLAPWERYDLHRSARGVALLDQGVVVVVILNTGGLLSLYWGVAAGVLLLYIIRFGLSRGEMAVVLVVAVALMVLAGTLYPLPIHQGVAAMLGILLTIVLVMVGGNLLVSRERKAIEQAFSADQRAIARIVNTVQHEVNNPLAIAAGNMEMMRLLGRGEDDANRIERIETALGRIKTAVSQLRELETRTALEGEGVLERFVSGPAGDASAGGNRDAADATGPPGDARNTKSSG